MEKIVLAEKFKRFDEQWSPRIVAELNDNYLLLAKLEVNLSGTNTTTRTSCFSWSKASW